MRVGDKDQVKDKDNLKIRAKIRYFIVQVYSAKLLVAYGGSFLARVLMLSTKRRWIWGFSRALIVMGMCTFHHSQRLMEFVSSLRSP